MWNVNIMKYLKLGSSDLNASVVGMEAWVIGGGASWGSHVDDDLAIATIEQAFDSGINLFDTAPGYGWGHSEKLLGRVIQDRRDQFLIATKCGLWWEDQFHYSMLSREPEQKILPLCRQRGLSTLTYMLSGAGTADREGDDGKRFRRRRFSHQCDMESVVLESKSQTGDRFAGKLETAV